MKIAFRLYTAVAPAVLGVLLVAALSYWGQPERSAPTALLIVAATAAVGSLALAWRNTREVVRRVEALAGTKGDARVDEIDAIDQRLTSLDAEAARARSDASYVATESARRMEEYAMLIADAAATARLRVDEARTPVHILLTNQFGELNENQEEMLGAAESALISLVEELTKLETIADIDRGALAVRCASVRVSDMLLALCPMLNAQAKKEGVRLVFDLEPALPRVMADAPRLHDALRLALTDDVRYAVPGSTVTVQASSSDGAVTILVHHGSRHSYAGNILLAARLLSVQGGSLEHEDGRTVITLPRDDAQVHVSRTYSTGIAGS